MQTVILCGGLGTRLREETEFRPKPMVPIGAHPILWHIMKIYAQYNHKEFVLALGYKGEMIKDYFVNYEWMTNDITLKLGNPETLRCHNCNDEADWTVTLANTGANSQKGSRIKQIEKYITDDTFMMTYGDGVANVNIDALLDFHHSHGKIATLTGVSPGNQFGELQIKGSQVTDFREKPETGKNNFVNSGFFVLNRKIFDYLTFDENCDFEYGPLEKLARQGELMVYKHHGYWGWMDTIRDTERLNAMWNSGEAAWKTW
ncbi:glucose-1-phosphate cytidylyltransferase [Maridesulfovibrio ferrireducens]|uniref:glucose-1-phosphate cytidylyltransferase n=1 Tax=Maridesulfovibrio ferrireducens TaxID=246191 RepID=UPI001A1BC0AA|nr:glucose-1-phosphate cytidylyltransferase [Maridesulfovibrio ferrireducens]MBI9113157.1 glucose-1-phosphate cytidylyltransferase [Maridesulfovibrio ferrireducens]